MCENLQVHELPQTMESIKFVGFHDVEPLIEALKKSQTYCHLQRLNISIYILPIKFPIEFLPPTLRELRIHNRGQLEFPLHHSLEASLERLTVSSSSLESYPLDFFPNLSNLHISWCQNLESLTVSDGLLCKDLKYLSSLEIYSCK